MDSHILTGVTQDGAILILDGDFLILMDITDGILLTMEWDGIILITDTDGILTDTTPSTTTTTTTHITESGPLATTVEITIL